jgi:nicotinamide-nucleotide amidase
MQQLKAEILTIGDEILYGQIHDTNATWLSQQLTDAGFKVQYRSTIGDDREDILAAFATAEAHSQIVIITGGLGPTADDLTKPVLTEYFNTRLVRNQEVLNHLEELFDRRGRELLELNKQQADVPEAGKVVFNEKGTAPGMWLERNGRVFVSLPGVPFEMKNMVSTIVLPWLIQKFKPEVIYHRKIRTAGVPESYLASQIADWETSLPNHIKLAYLPHHGMVDLRMTAFGNNLDKIKLEVAEQEAKVLPLIQKSVYGYDADELSQVVGDILLRKNLKLATAESCTGGSIAQTIVSRAGSSRYFNGSIIAYQNELKNSVLEVPFEYFRKYGAVSEEVVLAMAQTARRKLDSHVAISTSGVAGPGGGTDDKPVGTVWIGISVGDKSFAKKFTFTKDRGLNIHLTTVAALNLLRQTLIEND